MKIHVAQGGYNKPRVGLFSVNPRGITKNSTLRIHRGIKRKREVDKRIFVQEISNGGSSRRRVGKRKTRAYVGRHGPGCP